MIYNHRLAVAALTVLLTAVLVGCASVDVVKVTPENDSTVKGFRYYLPRPYVLVKKPFPVFGNQCLVTGVTNGNNEVTINTYQLPDEFFDYFDVDELPTKKRQTLTFTLTSGPSTVASEAKGASTPAPDGSATGSLTPSKTPAPGADDTGATKPTGSSYSPVTKVNDYFDIADIMDFTQQYAVNPDAGIGTVKLELSLGNGWMLTDANVNVDNTEVGKMVSDSVGKILDLGLAVAKGAAIPGSNLISTGTTTSSEALSANQSGGKGSGNTFPPNVHVLLSVNYYLEAQIGQYPFLKPEELQKLTNGHWDGQLIEKGRYAYIPYGPITAVPYNVRKVVTVSVVNVIQTAPAQSLGDGQGGGSKSFDPLTPVQKTKLDQWWQGAPAGSLPSEASFTFTYDGSAKTVHAAPIAADPNIAAENTQLTTYLQTHPLDLNGVNAQVVIDPKSN